MLGENIARYAYAQAGPDDLEGTAVVEVSAVWISVNRGTGRALR